MNTNKYGNRRGTGNEDYRIPLKIRNLLTIRFRGRGEHSILPTPSQTQLVRHC